MNQKFSMKYIAVLWVGLFWMNSKALAQPMEENLVTTSDNVKLYTKKSGKGLYLLYVHGGPGAWSKSFEDLGGKNLEDEFTVVYYDQRGCGRSESPQHEDYTLERMMLDIEEIRQFYKIDQFFIMGHSFGGVLITQYAHLYPQNLRGLILLNSTLNIYKSIEDQTQYFINTLELNYENHPEDLMARFQVYQNKMIEKDISIRYLQTVKRISSC